MAEERLFWMNRNIQGLEEVGYLMTLDQLKSELGNEKIGYNENLVETFLSGNTFEEMEGSFWGNDTYTIREVREEEVRALMTWNGYDHEESHASGSLDEEYPEFVHPDLICGRYIYNFTGVTYEVLPVSGEQNPTIQKYMEKFGLTEKDLSAEVTDLDLAKGEISEYVAEQGDRYDEGLTPETYNGILDKYHLEQYKVDPEKYQDSFERDE